MLRRVSAESTGVGALDGLAEAASDGFLDGWALFSVGMLDG